MFETYHPQRFCSDFVAVKQESGHLVNFMAVVLGLKPLMDDWVPVARLDDYRAMCAAHGLHCEPESIFHHLEKRDVPPEVVGRDAITSTCAYALPLESGAHGNVHVFVSRDPVLLRHGMWYSMIVRDRLIWPPRIDLLKYGRLLGYPECCVRFFRKRNDWKRYSFLEEIRRRSTTFHPWCNPLVKDGTYSYIYHMPCSFSCPATVEGVKRLRHALLEREPALVERIDAHLVLPALVLRERKVYIFDGTAAGHRIEYCRSWFVGGDSSADVISTALAEGNVVEVQGQQVHVLKDRDIIRTIECDATGFAPEIPFVASFRDLPLSTRL